MSEIIAIAVPFFGLIALGYGVGRRFQVPSEGIAGLNLFVFYVALPALFFRMVAMAPFALVSEWSFFATTTFATYCAFAIAFSIGALLNRGRVPEATMQGLIGSYANIAYLAPSLTLVAFGVTAGAPTALIFAFDTALLLVLVPLMISLGGTERMRGREMARSIGRNIILHPLIIATLAGLVVSFIGVGLPGPLDPIFGFVGSAGPPAALFTVGLGLAQRDFGRVTFEMPAVILVKLVGHPLIVYLLLGWIGGFDPVWVKTAVLIAALPPALNVLIFARKYGTYIAEASTAVLLATAASVVTVVVTLVLVLNDFLPSDPFH